MATSMAYEQQTQTGAHLMINTFGQASLYYHDKEIASSDEQTKQPIGTLDFKFLVRVNANGTFDIQRKEGVCFNTTIETTTKICQIQARADEVIVPPWYTLNGDILCQKFSLRMAEFVDSHFRVRLFGSNVFRRVDIRFLKSSWATMLIHENKLMNICINGSRELEILQLAGMAMVDRDNRSAGENKYRFGLKLGRKFQRNNDDNRSVSSMASSMIGDEKISRSQANPIMNQAVLKSTEQAPISSENVVSPDINVEPKQPNIMPNLVQSSNADGIREGYIGRLQFSLAALTLPRMSTDRITEKDEREQTD